jgi:hypothetical protein
MHPFQKCKITRFLNREFPGEWQYDKKTNQWKQVQTSLWAFLYLTKGELCLCVVDLEINDRIEIPWDGLRREGIL